MEKERFTPSNLKDGMICMLRNGEKRIVFKNKLVDGWGGRLHINDYDEEFCDKNNVDVYDIMQVKDLQDNILWQREKEVKYTKALLIIKNAITQLEDGPGSNEEKAKRIINKITDIIEEV
jgi:hypothetical protein